jgi:hypothetical protein
VSDVAGRLERLSPAQRRLFEAMRGRSGGAAGALAPGPDLVPLGPEQEHTWRWYAWTNEVGYNYGIPLWLEGRLDVGALERAVQQVVDRHDALRARIVVEDGRPYQRIADPAPVVLPLIDLQHVPAERRPAAALERLHRFLDERFDPLGEHLWRASLLRLGPLTHVLAMSLDELVCDARSRLVLITELAEVYAANREGRPARLAELTQDYAGYLRERRSWLGGPEAAGLAAAWRAELSGSRPLPLAGDRPWTPERGFGGVRLGYLVPDQLLGRLRAACAGERVTRYVWMLAVFGALLSRYAGRTDVVVNTHVLNRLTPASRDLVGAFTAPMLSRCRWTGDPTFRELLGVASAAALAAYARKELPVSHVAGGVGWPECTLRTPAAQFHLSVNRDSREGLRLPVADGLAPRFEYAHLGRFSGELGLFCYELEDELEIMIEYRTELFDEPTILRLRDHLATLLERATANPERPLSALLAGIDSLVG